MMIPLIASLILVTSSLTFGSTFDAGINASVTDDPISMINKTINAYISKIPNPLRPEDVQATFENISILRGDLLIKSLSILGLSDTYASTITIGKSEKGSTFNATLKIPFLSNSFKYSIDAITLEAIPLYGKGTNSILFDDLEVMVGGPLNILNISQIDVKDLWFSIYIRGSAMFGLHGLINNEDFSAMVNTALDDNFANFVNHNSNLISQILIFIIKQIYGGFSWN